MLKLKYEVIIYWSNDDKSFVAEIPERPAAWLTGIPLRRP